MQRREQYPGLILRRNYRSHFEGISLPKLIQILVREVLNWQVKPCKNIRSFWKPVTSKAYLRSFVCTLLLFDLVLSKLILPVERIKPHTSADSCCWQQLSTECWADTHTQSPQFQFETVPYKSDPFGFFVHINDKRQQGPILWQCKSQDHHDDDEVFPQAPSSSAWDR